MKTDSRLYVWKVAAFLAVCTTALAFLASSTSRAADDSPADYVLISQEKGITHVRSGKTKATLFKNPGAKEAIHWAMNHKPITIVTAATILNARRTAS